MLSRLPATLLVASLLGALVVSGCASRTLSSGVAPLDMAQPPPLDMAQPSPLDMALPPPDIALSNSNSDLAFERECSFIAECIIEGCSSSDTGCIDGCEAGHSAEALADAQTLMACAIPNCGSTFSGNGGNVFDAVPCLSTKCNAQFSMCAIPLPSPP